MERRIQTRVEIPLNGTLVIPGSKGEPLHCTALDISNTGMRLRIRDQIDPGTQIRVEIADCVFVGEVVWNKPTAGYFEMGVHIVHKVNCVNKLAEISTQVDNPVWRDDSLPKPLPRAGKPLLRQDPLPQVVFRRR